MSSNTYGLDFLRTEHTLNEEGEPKRYNESSTSTSVAAAAAGAAGLPSANIMEAAAHKPDLEKQFDVIHFLQAHRSAGCLAPDVIYQRTGIDLIEDEMVAQMLQHNSKIRIEHVPDPENPSLMIATYAYQAKYNHVRDRTTLLAQINRCKNGVPRRDLEDAYDGVEKDLDVLITAGDVLAIVNTEDKDKILFPRGEPFLVELDGIINIPEIKLKKIEEREQEKNQEVTTKESTSAAAAASASASTSETDTKPDAAATTTAEGEGEAPPASDPPAASSDPQQQQPSQPLQPKKKKIPRIDVLETDIDPRRQIRRGEAAQIGGQWFRVSSAIKEGPLKDQPARAQAPLSVVMLQDLSKRNESDGYIRPLDAKHLSTDARLSKTAIGNLRKAKEAREKLLKLAHGRSGSGGVASQLLGSHAHSSNPTTLAASFGSTSTSSRKRPNKQGGTGTGSTAADRARQQAMANEAKQVASDPYLALYTHARRHGCTKDVREMYLATRSEVPDGDHALKRMLLEHKLLEPGEEMRRPLLKKKANVDNDGKPKKRRYYERKNQRMTNTHLEGTEIGAILMRATEKQKQGESVGDGGM